MRCLVCSTSYKNSPTVACFKCRSEYHPECFSYAGKCAVYGCEEQKAVDFSKGAIPEWTWTAAAAGLVIGLSALVNSMIGPNPTLESKVHTQSTHEAPLYPSHESKRYERSR